MNPQSFPLTRRGMLQTSANGFGFLALAALLAERSSGAEPGSSSGLPRPRLAARAKNVIFCFMDGGVSHVDSFDPKPKLTELDGQTVGNHKNASVNSLGARKWLKSPWKFKQHGRVGLSVSELFPQIASCADDLAVIRSMKADLPLHGNSVLALHTGHGRAGRPSLGSWLNYGLGTVNRNLPGFVVLGMNGAPPGGIENFSSGFLPANFQATILKSDGTVDNLAPAYKKSNVQRLQLESLRTQNRAFSKSLGTDDAIESAIRNYEMAYRMQTEVPDVLDLSKEDAATKALYGIDAKEPLKQQYAMQCLRARRLVEAGVRFVEVCCPSKDPTPNGVWDQHGKLKEKHEENAFHTDQAVAGLLKDLKRRGMLGETLVLWASEFGRTPHCANPNGRDHHNDAFTIWLAGGGVKGGIIYGATDELGMQVAEKPVPIHDLHATILYLLGLDHEQLTFRYGGRDFRLTDFSGVVIDEILS
jgi:hypothetical protein